MQPLFLTTLAIKEALETINYVGAFFRDSNLALFFLVMSNHAHLFEVEKMKECHGLTG